MNKAIVNGVGILSVLLTDFEQVEEPNIHKYSVTDSTWSERSITTHHDVKGFYVLVNDNRISSVHELNTSSNPFSYGNPLSISCL